MAGEEEHLNALKVVEVEELDDEESEAHNAELAGAYAAFASRHVDVEPSNPAPEGETFVKADLVVTSEEPQESPEGV